MSNWLEHRVEVTFLTRSRAASRRMQVVSMFDSWSGQKRQSSSMCDKFAKRSQLTPPYGLTEGVLWGRNYWVMGTPNAGFGEEKKLCDLLFSSACSLILNFRVVRWFCVDLLGCQMILWQPRESTQNQHATQSLNLELQWRSDEIRAESKIPDCAGIRIHALMLIKPAPNYWVI